MGKKRVIQKGETETKENAEPRAREVKAGQKLSQGIAHIQATYNNTIIMRGET